MKLHLLAILAALSGQTATADILCTTASGERSYLIDETAQTITVNDLPAIQYSTPAQPLTALFGLVRANVDLPRPSHIASGQSGFSLRFGRFDTITLTENFTSLLSTPEMAFAPIEDIMETVQGIHCVQIEASP